MPKKLTQEQFIEKCTKAHGDKYDYSQAIYIGSKIAVKIICKEHGLAFEQKPELHYVSKLSGCTSCNSIVSHSEEFIAAVVKVHGDRYNYDKVIYVNMSTEVIITCKVHGDFPQRPFCHKNGQGCAKCAHSNLSKVKMLTKEEYIAKCVKVHGEDKYMYDEIIYTGMENDVKWIYCIKCDMHFDQNAHNHERGGGCTNCDRNRKETEDENRARNKEIFIETCNQLFDRRFDYSLVDYVNDKTAVQIICKEHNYKFEQTPFLSQKFNLLMSEVSKW